jgi:hypothetical protein
MLEILLIFFACRALGNMLRAKGRKPIGYQIWLVLMWFGSEFAAGFVMGMIQVLQNGGQADMEFDLSIYIVAIVAAAVGAGIVFTTAALLPPVKMNNPYLPTMGAAPNVNQPRPNDPSNPYA